MKTYLVAGGAGFIGTNLCLYLLKNGNKVIAVDDFSSGSKKNLLVTNKQKNFSFIEHDINFPLKVKEQIDGIFHFASRASPPDYQSAPLHTMWTNALGTKNMAELALQHNATLLYASTSEVYGDALQHPQKESYWGNVNPHGMRSCYDESKRFGESLLFSYRQEGKPLKYKIIRIFNTYGPHMKLNDGRVVTNFISQALKGEPLTIYGDGFQTRSFCYVDDLVVGVVKMMEHISAVGPMNLGNQSEYTVIEVAKLILSLIPNSSKLIYKPLPSDDPIKRQPDHSMAKSVLGWSPTTPLKEGLQKTIAYFKE